MIRILCFSLFPFCWLAITMTPVAESQNDWGQIQVEPELQFVDWPFAGLLVVDILDDAEAAFTAGDYKKAMDLYAATCFAADLPEACARSGELLEQYPMPDRRPMDSIHLLEKACEAGIERSCARITAKADAARHGLDPAQ